MKKTFIMCALAFAAVLSAKEVSFNMKRAKIGDTCIPFWHQNFHGAKTGHGKGEVIAATKAGAKAFKITSFARNTVFFSGAAYNISVGDTLEISARVKGKGSVIFSYYGYTIKGAFLPVPPTVAKKETLSNDWKNIKLQIKIVPSMKGEQKRIRPVVTALANSEVILEDVKMQLIPVTKK